MAARTSALWSASGAGRSVTARRSARGAAEPTDEASAAGAVPSSVGAEGRVVCGSHTHTWVVADTQRMAAVRVRRAMAEAVAVVKGMTGTIGTEAARRAAGRATAAAAAAAHRGAWTETGVVMASRSTIQEERESAECADLSRRIDYQDVQVSCDYIHSAVLHFFFHHYFIFALFS